MAAVPGADGLRGCAPCGASCRTGAAGRGWLPFGMLQAQTTGDGRLFQRKIVGAATMSPCSRGYSPFCGRRELPFPRSGAERRSRHGREECTAMAGEGRSGCSRCHDEERCGGYVQGAGTACRRSEESGGEGRQVGPCSAASRGRQGRYGAWDAGMAARRRAEDSQARACICKDKNKKCHNRGCGIS